MVSVVVPNYNYGRYLRQRIESILQQTYQHLEVILLDDASTDSSKEILLPYKCRDKVTHVLLNEQNTGSPFRQWVKGIELARGEYIWIAEADDLCEPTFLEQTVPLMEKYPQASVCFVGSTHIDEEGRVVNRDANKWSAARQAYAVFDGKTYAERNLYWCGYIANASSAIFRRDRMNADKVQKCLQMRYSGDWLFWFHMAMQGDIIECYQILNHFRQHTQKVTVKAERNGGGKSEDIEIIGIMEQSLAHLSRYKRCIRRGMLYNRIAKLPAAESVKRQLWRQLREKLNGTRSDGRLERLNRLARLFCPFVLTMKRDRLTPSQGIG